MHLAPLLSLAAVALASADDMRDQARAALAEEVQAAFDNDPAPQATRFNTGKQMLLGGGDDYAPYEVDCPSGQTWVREATDGLCDSEKSYLAQRAPGIKAATEKMMAKVGLSNPPRSPVIGLALSGGGYRAMINGLGMTMALMEQNEEATNAGTGGWLDAVSYMAGLSGGSWGTGSFMANGGQLPSDLVNNVWNLDSNLIYPSDGKVKFYRDLLSNVRAKTGKGFPTQITDYWALALGDHLLPVEYRMSGSPNYTIDAMYKTLPQFQNAELPLPILIAAEREPGEHIVGSNATTWEFTPFEFGAWAIGYNNLTAGMFMPIEHVGSEFHNGQPNGTCYRGFDQLSFIMGTSSTLFNYGIVTLNGTDAGILTDVIKDILAEIGEDQNDVSQVPNFARGYKPESNVLHGQQYLTLIDAGETNNNIPLDPLLVPPRAVDTILAFDNSADTTYSWPNGSAMWTTYQRALEFVERENLPLLMPPVPSTNGFVNSGLNTRPVFFGCNDTSYPLVVYVPHYPWSWYSNSTTFTLQYDNATALSQMESAMRSLTLNGTVPEWPKCLACALTDRAFGYTTENRTADCAQCFDTWCYGGVDASDEPSDDYEPLMYKTPSFMVDRNLSNSVQESGVSSTEAKESSADHTAPLVALSATVVGVALGAVAFVLH